MADNILNKIKNKILGNELGNEDFITNKAIETLDYYKNKDSNLGYLELIKSVISKSDIEGSTIKDVTYGGSGDDIAGPELYGQKERLNRYNLYESIKTYIPYCNRALNVLADNILSPDDMTKISLFVQNNISSENKETPKIESIIKKTKLEKYLNQIIKNTILNGDYFVEIASTRDAILNHTILNENIKKNPDDFIIESGIFKIDKKEQLIKINIDFRELESEITPSIFNESLSYNTKTKKEEKKKDGEDNLSADDISLILHSPSRVIKLQTEMFPICMGYLVFPRYNRVKRLSFEQDQLNQFCNKIAQKIKNKLSLNDELDDKTKDDIKNILSDIIGYSRSENVMVRYVSPDLMQHFLLPSDKYLPYGESVFDSVAFSSKVLIALESALAIQRINKSTERLKIGVEIGMSRDAAKMVQSLQEELEKKKISIDDYNTIDSIPSSISTFENIYVPQRDGKEFVSINGFNEGNTDIRSKVEDLKFLRDQIVSSTMVPPSFLGIEENLCASLTTRIHLINGTIKTLEELIIMYENGEKIPDVYSCDKDGNIVPGKITWAGKTRLNTQLIRVWLDNNEYVDTTLDHPFMLRDGTYKEAQYLEEGESLMPFYTRTVDYLKTKRGNYQQVYFPGSNTWLLIYQAFANYWKIYPDNEDKYVIHHINMNPRDNRSENLVALTFEEHMVLHGRLKDVFSEEDLESIVRDRSQLKWLCEPGNTIIDDKCVICGKTFKRLMVSNTVTCSKECLSEYHRYTGSLSWESRKDKYPKRIVHCALCGKERVFRAKDFNPDKFYSCRTNDRCTSFVRSLNRTIKMHGKKYSDISYSTCVSCGKMIIVSPDRKNKVLTNVCHSMKCINKIKKGKDKDLSLYVEFTCPVCNDKFLKRKSDIVRNKYKLTCGKKECFEEYKKVINADMNKDHRTYGICSVCGDKFPCTKYYLKTAKHPRCDKEECKKAIYSISNKKESITYYCSICGDKVETTPGMLKDKHKGVFKSCYKESCKKLVRGINISASRKGTKSYIDYNNCPICGKLTVLSKYKSGYKTATCSNRKCINTMLAFNRENNNIEYKDYLPKVANKLNHKVLKTELLEGLHDTGDIRIEKYHNFATEAGVFIHNSNKNALSQENILFARAVINYQKIFGHDITTLVMKIIKLVDPENYFDYVEYSITFPTPKNLQFENEARNINDIVSMIGSLKEIGIPIEYLKEKYLITMDWKKIKEIVNKQNVDDHFNPPPPKEGY